MKLNDKENLAHTLKCSYQTSAARDLTTADDLYSQVSINS